MLLKKRINKIFEYPEMEATIEITAFVNKVPYHAMQDKKKKQVNFLKAVNKKDREELLKAFDTNNIGKILGNIEDISAVKDLLNDLEDNIKMCLGDSLELKVICNGGEEVLTGKNAEEELQKDNITWLAEECVKINPELFNRDINEKKK